MSNFMSQRIFQEQNSAYNGGNEIYKFTKNQNIL